MTLPAPVDLLRSIYRRLDRRAVCEDFPGMTEGELADFFRTLSLVCQGCDPAPPAGPGRSAGAAPKPPPAEQVERNAPPALLKGAARSVTLFTDGGSRGNPGPAGCGFALFDEANREVARGKRYLGVATNNVAEYEGVVAGLKAALQAGAERVVLKCDSDLIVKQLRGSYRVKAPGLQGLYAQAKGLLSRFASWQAVHVPREQNALADALANEAMDRGSG